MVLRQSGLPHAVVQSNLMSELAAGVMAAIHSQGGVFVAESPPSRAAGSRFPIEGRERHASQFDHPSWLGVQQLSGARFIYFDHVKHPKKWKYCENTEPNSLSVTPFLNEFVGSTASLSNSMEISALKEVVSSKISPPPAIFTFFTYIAKKRTIYNI